MTINTPNGPAPDLTPEDRAYLDRAFAYHEPAGDQPERYVAIRAAMKMAATVVLTVCPPSRERSLALTKLEEAMFWANASIARSGK